MLLAESNTAAQVAAAAAAATQKPVTMTLLQAVENGGWAMIPLACMSILMVMLIFAYAITLRRNAVVSAHFMNTAEVLLKKEDYMGLLAIANRHSESIARVIRRMLDFAAKNPAASFEVIREIGQTEGSAQTASLEHRITYLADIAVLSPMVGLLGTVIGIICSFATIANSSEQTRSTLLSGGVSDALFATAGGLIVGIISMAFYGLFRNRVQSLISELEGASAQLLALLAVNFGKVGEEPRENRREIRRGEERERTPAPVRRAAVSVDDEF